MDHPIGRPLAELDTPALCIDLDVFEANVAAMAGYIADCGKQWRPHAKCHKSPAIAHRLLQAGAIGVTVAKVSEAEVFLRAGVRDVLIANMIAGETKVNRVAALCRHGDPIVAVDHFAQAEALAAACRRQGVCCRVLVEINIGMDRVGIRPGPDAIELAQGVDRLEGVRLVGVMGYEGHLLRVEDPDEKRRKIDASVGLLEEARDRMQRAGICAEIVSAGGTGSYQFTSHCPAVTELQAGGGIFADPFYIEQCGVEGLTPSLSVLATVVSRPMLERGIVDAGRKTLNGELHMPVVKSTVAGRSLPDAKLTALSAEHGFLKLGPESQDLTIGEKVSVIPGYSDSTTVLHDRFYGIRAGQVEVVWPLEARGCLQ
ncbi:MAG: DSD1 family PLP-dependent enzyme [Maioricimonas sp. JB049]